MIIIIDVAKRAKDNKMWDRFTRRFESLSEFIAFINDCFEDIRVHGWEVKLGTPGILCHSVISGKSLIKGGKEE